MSTYKGGGARQLCTSTRSAPDVSRSLLEQTTVADDQTLVPESSDQTPYTPG